MRNFPPLLCYARGTLPVFRREPPTSIRFFCHHTLKMHTMNRVLLSTAFLLLIGFSCKNSDTVNADLFKRQTSSVVVRMEGEADRLNPYLTTTNYGSMVVDNLFMHLLTFNPVTLSLEPDLAVSRPVVRDISAGPFAGGVAYDFEILKEAVWDNGTPVTGYDYLFSVKAALNPLVQAAPLRAYLADLADVQVDAANPKKFTVSLYEKTFLGEETAGGLLAVLPEYRYDPAGLLRKTPLADLLDPTIAEKRAATDASLKEFADAFNSDAFSRDPKKIGGCGPYELLQWVTDQQIVLRKKADWWGEKVLKARPSLAVYPDSLIFRPIPNPATALAALRNEEIDVMGNIPAEDFQQLKADAAFNARYALGTVHSMAYYYIGVNSRDPLLQDKRVRQALSRVIDAAEIVEEVFQGFGKRIAAPVPPSAAYYPSNTEPLTVDLEAAKKLLAEAGWKDSDNNGVLDKVLEGKRSDLQLKYLLNASSEQSRTIGLLIQSNARKVGIDIVLDAKEPTSILEQLSQRNFQLISAGKTQTPLWNPMQNWHTEGDNRFGFGDTQTDALIEDILKTMDENTRNEKMKKLLARIREEQVEILLFSPEDRIAIHQRFDAKMTPFSPGFTPNQFKLKK